MAADTGLRATLARWLMGAGYGVELAENPKRAREIVAGESVHLAVVDPEGLGPGGTDLVSDLSRSVAHVVLIGDPSADEAGRTDGCIAKPPQEQEVLARVNAVLQLSASRDETTGPQFLRVAEFTIDLWGRECRNAAGELVPLTRAEFSLLAAFARAPGRVLSRDELNQVVSGRAAQPEDASVYVLISRLRRKMEPDPKQPQLIVTMPGEGYKLNTPVLTIIPQNETPTVAGKDEAQLGAGKKPADRVRLSRWAIGIVISSAAAAAGWGAWTTWEPTPAFSPFGRTPPQSAAADQRREAAFTRMVAAMQDDRFDWRTVDRLAIEAGVSESEAHEILAAHSSDVILGKSGDGKLLARLRQR